MRRRSLWRFVRIFVVWTLVTFMAIPPATACRFLSRWRAVHSCWTAVCCDPCGSIGFPVYGMDSYSYGCDSVGMEYPVGGEIIDYGVSGYPPSEMGAPSMTPPPPAQPPQEMPPPPTEAPEIPDDLGDVIPPPSEQPTTPRSAPPSTPPSTPPTIPPTQPELPAEPEDTFEPGDLFGETPTTPPAETPEADTEFAPGNDLFPPTPSTQPSTPPTTPPTTPPSTPAPTPGTTPPAEEEGDLFGGFFDDTEESSTPADEGTAPDTAEPPAGDDLFNPPTSDANPEDDLGDLFSSRSPRDAEPLTALPTAASRPETSARETVLPMRTWTDNTGQYQTYARLVEVGRTYVKLLKENGHPATVPLKRLSDQDFDYVSLIVQQYRPASASSLVANR